MTDLDLFPPDMLDPTARDRFIAHLQGLHLTPTARKKHFTDWSHAVGHRPTARDYTRVGADLR